jgi:hypothetical protein
LKLLGLFASPPVPPVFLRVGSDPDWRGLAELAELAGLAKLAKPKAFPRFVDSIPPTP